MLFEKVLCLSEQDTTPKPIASPTRLPLDLQLPPPRSQKKSPFSFFRRKNLSVPFGIAVDYYCEFIGCRLKDIADHCSLNESTLSLNTRSVHPQKETVLIIWEALVEIAKEQDLPAENMTYLLGMREVFLNAGGVFTDQQDKYILSQLEQLRDDMLEQREMRKQEEKPKRKYRRRSNA